MFALGGLLVMFSSCENDITAPDDIVSSENFNATVSQRSNDLVYLEIPDEYQAPADEEVVLITENGSFYNEEGEEIAVSIAIETTLEGGLFFSIAVSQSLIDYGYVNPDLGSLEKKWKDYYSKCLKETCSPPPANQTLQQCHNACSFAATVV